MFSLINTNSFLYIDNSEEFLNTLLETCFNNPSMQKRMCYATGEIKLPVNHHLHRKFKSMQSELLPYMSIVRAIKCCAVADLATFIVDSCVSVMRNLFDRSYEELRSVRDIVPVVPRILMQQLFTSCDNFFEGNKLGNVDFDIQDGLVIRVPTEYHNGNPSVLSTFHLKFAFVDNAPVTYYQEPYKLRGILQCAGHTYVGRFPHDIRSFYEIPVLNREVKIANRIFEVPICFPH